MKEVRRKQKNFLKIMKLVVTVSVIFIFVYIGVHPYIKDFSQTAAVVINYICDGLVVASLCLLLIYYSKYGKVELFLKDIENEIEDAGYYINSRKENTPDDLCTAILNDFRQNSFKISEQLEVKDFTFDIRALKGRSYIYIVKVDELDKNDILAYLDEMIYDLTTNCFKRKGNAVMCFITDKACDDAVAVSKMITPLGRKGQLTVALAIAETDTGNVYFQGNEENKRKTLIANYIMNCDMPIKDQYIHKEKLRFQYDLEEKVKSFTLKDYNSGKFYIH